MSHLPSGDGRAVSSATRPLAAEPLTNLPFRGVLETLPVAAYLTDAEGLVTGFNPLAAELWGREPRLNDPTDRYCGSFKLFLPDGTPVPHEECWMALALREGREYSSREIVIERPDGTRRAVLVHISPIRDDSDRLLGAINVVVDITERKRAAEENTRLLTEVSRLLEEVRESAERHRQLADNLPAGFIYQIVQASDGTGGFSYASAGVAALLGLSPEEVAADPTRMYSLIHPDDFARMREQEEAAMRAGTPFDCRFRVRGAKGEVRWLHCRSASRPLPAGLSTCRQVGIPTDGGNVWDGIAIDITDRVRAEEALRENEQRLRLALDAGRCGAWDWDIVADRVSWSDRIYEFHGLAPGEFSGRVEDFATLVHPDDAARVGEAIRRAVEEGASYGEEFRIVRPNGEVRWLNTHGRVLRDEAGRPVRMLGATTDVTDRRAAEESLRDTGRRKDEFIATLAHELRNPLAPLRNSLHILQLNEGDWNTVERVRGMMERQVSHLTRLVDDLLDASRITMGKVQLKRERLDLSRMIRQAAADRQETFASRGVALAVDAPAAVWVHGDATRLAQVVGNLLVNALKFTARGGEVAVTVTGSREERRAVVSVRDTGAGIEPEMLPRLFEPFTQFDHTLERSRDGLGLGLAIVKGLIEMHGGSVSATSAGLGRGSTFTVTLPSDLEAPALLTRPAAPAPEARRLKVLVVEDNRDAADSLRMLLEAYGYEVQVAYTGDDGVRLAGELRPQVVICDIGLPGMDGFAVAGALRGNPATAAARLIALTGYGQEDDHRRSRAAGFDEHLVKPADPATLRAALSQVR